MSPHVNHTTGLGNFTKHGGVQNLKKLRKERFLKAGIIIVEAVTLLKENAEGR